MQCCGEGGKCSRLRSMQLWLGKGTYLIGPGCILAVLRLRRPRLLRRLLGLLLGLLLRWWLLVRRRGRRRLGGGSLLLGLRRRVRVPLRRGGGLLVIHVAHGGGGRAGDGAEGDGEGGRPARRHNYRMRRARNKCQSSAQGQVHAGVTECRVARGRERGRTGP